MTAAGVAVAGTGVAGAGCVGVRSTAATCGVGVSVATLSETAVDVGVFAGVQVEVRVAVSVLVGVAVRTSVAVRDDVGVAVGTGGVGVVVGSGVIVGVAVAGAAGANVASSKAIRACDAEAGLKTIRTLAECAPSGAAIDPVDSRRNASSGASSVSSESLVASDVPDASSLAYQETRSHAASTPGSLW
jgi:hypothetical protein